MSAEPNDAGCRAGAPRSATPTEAAPDFTTFYRREYPGSVRLAFHLTWSRESAEELTQEAFAIIHDRYSGLESPGGYLRVTLINLCRRWHRTNHREQRRLRFVHTADVVQASHPEFLRDALAKLTYRQRTVLVLRYWSGLSEAEIARTLNCRPGTVKSLTSRALATLRKEIER